MSSSAYETIASNTTRIAEDVARILDRTVETQLATDLQNTKNRVTTLENRPYGYSRLKGKVFGMLGDSTVKGGVASVNTNTSQYCWDIVAARNGMIYKRYGIGGTCLSNTLSSAGDPAMVTRYVDMDNNIDYIGVSGGYNDASQNITIGNLDSNNDKEFCGALNILCEGLIKKYIGKKVFFVTPWNNRTVMDQKNDPYSEAIFNVASKNWGIPVLRADLISNIHPEIAEFRAVMMNGANDTVHLGVKGHLAFADVLESFMYQL